MGEAILSSEALVLTRLCPHCGMSYLPVPLFSKLSLSLGVDVFQPGQRDMSLGVLGKRAEMQLAFLWRLHDECEAGSEMQK